VGDTDRSRELRALADPLLDLARHVLAAAEQVHARGDVEEGLVEREPFDQVRELSKHLEHQRRDLAIALEARRHDDCLRAAPERLAHGHRGMHAEATNLVARGRDHAASARAADDHRLSGELRPVALLHGRIERVHVHVQDRAAGLAHETLYIANSMAASSVMPSSTQ
jgi:hypothetical protein